jgi:hypothetical protein
MNPPTEKGNTTMTGTNTNGSNTATVETLTATVETLTATVRTLAIGKRQITLSVAKQLDRVDLFEYNPDIIVPFGRVKTGAKIERERRKKGYRA